MSKDKENQIDEVFKKKFSDFEAPVQHTFSNIWDKAHLEEAKIIKLRPKRSFKIYKYLTAAMFAGLVLFSAYFWMTSDQVSGLLSDKNNNTGKQSGNALANDSLQVLTDSSASAVDSIKINTGKKGIPAHSKTPGNSTNKNVKGIEHRALYTFYTANETKEVTLPDSSVVLLNKNSTLNYTGDFKKNRILNFEGEGFFSVEKMKGQSFKIVCSNTVVEVLGTSFNVDSRSSDNQDKISVVSGLVKVTSALDRNKHVILKKGMSAIINQNGNIKSGKLDNFELAWKTRQFVFQHDPLMKILPIMEDYFSIKIKSSNEDILKCTFTGKFNNPTVEEFLTVLTSSLNLSYSQKEGMYIIEGQGCN